MTKMRMPEVGVVRFVESDIIVASTMILNLYNDKTAGNGSISYRGNIYYTKKGDEDFASLRAALGGGINEVILHNGNRMEIESVFYFENPDPEEPDAYSIYYPQVEGSDGVYGWDATNSVWTWRHQ